MEGWYAKFPQIVALRYKRVKTRGGWAMPKIFSFVSSLSYNKGCLTNIWQPFSCGIH